ncbi:uncharacterized protein B0I36DRAFT_351079 [Microdochium trichocladiopsis]|uniref:Uncharacterized protein n=1 Tax=Microdochium trichocladiopsis TaxID=1682393 RepID=A0A9P9BNB6_9PEZI|nr:uncharacterized protein B0I36DRAFT_351079 [Microdochium trichocladiopsis]KAH7027563.1 hypothetical protein B0I36DRAFT_351079 [Microdochium trichocladiopsis]
MTPCFNCWCMSPQRNTTECLLDIICLPSSSASSSLREQVNSHGLGHAVTINSSGCLAGADGDDVARPKGGASEVLICRVLQPHVARCGPVCQTEQHANDYSGSAGLRINSISGWSDDLDQKYLPFCVWLYGEPDIDTPGRTHLSCVDAATYIPHTWSLRGLVYILAW